MYNYMDSPKHSIDKQACLNCMLQLVYIFQISYASTSPILSDRVMYPLFFRTSPSKYVDLRYAMMNTYNWCYVATLHQTRNVFSLVSNTNGEHTFVSSLFNVI